MNQVDLMIAAVISYLFPGAEDGVDLFQDSTAGKPSISSRSPVPDRVNRVAPGSTVAVLGTRYCLYIQSHCSERSQKAVTSRCVATLLRQRMVEDMQYACHRHFQCVCNRNPDLALKIVNSARLSMDKIRQHASIERKLATDNVIPAKLPGVLPRRLWSDGHCLDFSKSCQ